MKKALWLVAALASLTVAQAQTTYTVSLSGAQEVPANASPGTGSGTLTLNLDNTLSYNISYSGLSSDFTASHIHFPAPPGVEANPVFPLNNMAIDTRSGTLSGATAALDPTQLSYLNDQLMYVNIHSITLGGGEIRGQIVPEPSTLALIALGAGALFWRLRRKA
jgi:CHRD domain-containing protein/PEP-CTERM motif-containing protein